MRVLQVNKFFYYKGGSERVFFDTVSLLRAKGHEILTFSMRQPQNLHSSEEEYFVSEVDFKKGGLTKQVTNSMRLLYSLEARRKLEDLIRKERPQLAHLYNIYHQISPSILHSLKKFGIPVVMSLYDFKVVCASYLMLQGGKPCEECKGGKYYRCLMNSCVKGSRLKSLISALEMHLHHDLLGIYRYVDYFISPSLFLKHKVKEMGFNGKVINLAYSIDCSDYIPQYQWQEDSIVYFGRLSPEKGLFTILEAVKENKNLNLKIIGDGPIKEALIKKAEEDGLDNVNFLGYKPENQMRQEIGKAKFVIMASECYENYPRSVMEAFALGKPVIGSNIGGIPELVREGETGLLFNPGDAKELSSKIDHLNKKPQEIIAMGVNARRFVEEKLGPEVYYQKLMDVYYAALRQRHLAGVGGAHV